MVNDDRRLTVIEGDVTERKKVENRCEESNSHFNVKIGNQDYQRIVNKSRMKVEVQGRRYYKWNRKHREKNNPWRPTKWWGHRKFEVEEETLAKCRNMYIGRVTHPGNTYNIQERFYVQGVTNVKVTPMGANLVIIYILRSTRRSLSPS